MACKRKPCVNLLLIHYHFLHFSHEGYSGTLAHSRSARSKFLCQTPATPLIRQRREELLEVEAAREEDYFANSRNRGFTKLAIIVARTAISRVATPINSSDNSPASPHSSKLTAV